MLLDEPTSALDIDATVAFHEAIRDNCPGASVISVMHDATPPKSSNGEEFFDSVLSITEGTVTKTSLSNLKSRPVGPARVEPRPEKRPLD
ncbi:hypothetical protein [Ensifer adhaerens]|uniref:hypothetical protein n=1 Tax=Ensifer adhaerens TaxID=106592 RepID=UPI001F196595|nr:hypothetical protein [Ensifer adhaerens]